MTPVATGVRSALKRQLRSWEAGLDGMRAWDFPSWNQTLDDALAVLPPLATCPHDLFRALAEQRGDVSKVNVLVCRRDRPLAVLALRSTGGPWEPVTMWITPGLPFPFAHTGVLPILRAVGLPMNFAWWRCPGEPPRSRRVVTSAPELTYRLPCDADPETHWRKTSLLHNVRNARRRCESFSVAADVPGAYEWVIRNWGLAWRVAPHHVEDMLLAARMRVAQGRYHSLVVYDNDRAIAGATEIEDDGDLVGQAVFRDPDYERHSLGTFVIDRLFAWAVERGFKGLDFGGTASYKERWAPVGGRKFTVSVMPLYRAIADALRRPFRR